MLADNKDGYSVYKLDNYPFIPEDNSFYETGIDLTGFH